MAGIVHFSNFYRFMEEAEHEMFRRLGFKIVENLPDGSVVGWPRVRASCSFEAPAYYDDLVDIDITVTRVGVKSLTMSFQFRRGDLQLAIGELKTVFAASNTVANSSRSRSRRDLPRSSMNWRGAIGDMPADLEITNVSKSFPTAAGDLPILTGVNLSLSRGEELVVMGPSGAGKSTLLYIIGTLDTPSGGSVSILGQDPFALDRSAVWPGSETRTSVSSFRTIISCRSARSSKTS